VGPAHAFEDLARAEWQERDLREGELRFCDLRGAALAGVKAAGSFWQHCSLRGADLDGADLTDAVLSECLLERASLRGAIMTGARLVRCSFDEAVLTDATLAGATTVGCSFQDAELTGIRDVATARDIVVEVLKRHAGGDPELLRWVGLVAVKREWCYDDWVRELARSPRHKALALEAFAPFPAAGFAEALSGDAPGSAPAQESIAS
jgi:uncharacterized protein YjbI with pentapeptide repeats